MDDYAYHISIGIVGTADDFHQTSRAVLLKVLYLIELRDSITRKEGVVMNNILYIMIFSTLLFPYSDSGKLFSMETEDGKTETKQDTVEIEEKLAAVRIGDKWGYINVAGEVVIEPQFDHAHSFHEGLAVVRIGDSDSGKYGYINVAGEIAIKPQFHKANAFSEGLAHVMIGNKWGYIDREGKIVIEPQFDKAFSFKNGLALVRENDEKKDISILKESS